MKKEQLQQEFQQIKDELLTFAFSEQLSPTLPYKNTKNHSNSERHRLELTNKNHLNNQKALNLKQINSNIKKIESSLGKIITLGSATFKSNFECGNLSNVKLLSSNTFQLELETQTNSNRISNWFDFTVEGIKGQANFIIKGFTKSSSLYNEGMKVCYRDISELSKWQRGGTKITYTNSQDEEEQECKTYELRFSFFFKSNACIEFAYCFPYGLKKLYHLIHQIKDKVNYQTIGKTFNGLDIPLITIGNESKQVIVLSARVHPGQTVSSFIIQGFIRELISDSQYAQSLRSKYLFKIIPMLNPDGVIKGNYRFSGYGCDLNRKWSSCKPNSQPEVYFLKELIKEWNKQKKVIMYIDIHGHSRKKNVFFYGCCNKQSGNLRAKQFPYLMQKVYDSFKYSYCSFTISKDKQGTARVTLWKELQIDYIYTLQASFSGTQHGPNYNESDYEKIGKKLCQGMSIFFYQKESAINPIMQKMLEMKQQAFAQLQQNDRLYNFEDENGSESQPQKGQIQQIDRNSQTGLPKKESLIKNIHRNQRQKKVVSAISFFPRSFRSEKNKSIVSERTILPKPAQTSQMKNHLQIQLSPPYAQKQSQPFRFKKYSQVQEQNPLFTKNYESFKNAGLYPRKIRVYSLNRNAQKQVQKTQPFLEQAQQTKNSLKVSLMQGREGVQYRRVRKLVQQNYNRQMTATEQQSSYVVKQLQGNQLRIGKFEKIGRKCAVTPRFYPVTQQKNRRTSADIYLRKQNNQYPNRMSINVPQASINCKGIQITKYGQKMKK